MFKICCSCKKELSVENFSKNKSASDGLKMYCKTCASEQNKKYRANNREKVLKSNSEWYKSSKFNKEERTARELLAKEKKCNYCQDTKNIDEFYRRGNGGFYSECKNCCLLKQREYNKKNSAKIASRKKVYNIRNANNIKSYNERYYIKNKPSVKARVQAWIKNNNEAYKKQRVRATQKRNAKNKRLKNDLTSEQWNYCKKYFDFKCAYCDKVKPLTVEHFIPVNKMGAYTFSNILPACSNCNSSKQDKDFDTWFEQQDFYNAGRKVKIQQYFSHIKYANTVPSQ